MLNLMYKITNQASRNPIKILVWKTLETKDEELNFFILFLSSSEEKSAGVASDREHNDGGAEEKAVKEITMVRSRITIQVIQQYSDSRRFKMQTLREEQKHFKANNILKYLCIYMRERERDICTCICRYSWECVQKMPLTSHSGVMASM